MKFLPLIILFFVPGLLRAQPASDSTHHRYSLTIQSGFQKIGFPFRKPFSTPYHFYAGAGAARVWKFKNHQTTYQTLDAGVFLNSSSGNGYLLLSNFGYQYHFTPGIFLSGEIGGGFMHLFRPRAVYELQANGTYSQVRDWGKIHPAVDFNLQFGYQPNRFGTFLQYRIVSEFLYNHDAIIYPQTFLSIGLRYEI